MHLEGAFVLYLKDHESWIERGSIVLENAKWLKLAVFPNDMCNCIFDDLSVPS